MTLKCCVLMVLWCGISSAADWHAAPTGTPTGKGTLAAPWDLQSAFDHSDLIQPGDTLLLNPGTYVTLAPSRVWMVRLTATPDKPLTIRSVAGERAIIEFWNPATGTANFQVGNIAKSFGHNLVIRDLVFRNTRQQARASPLTPAWELHRGAIVLLGDNVKFVHNIVHDLGEGPTCENLVTGGEIYGNVIYNCGWIDGARGNGHGIYLQNVGPAPKIAENNIIYHGWQGSAAIHAYTADGKINHIHFLNNICFDVGAARTGPTGPTAARNLFYGSGQQVVRGAKIIGNVAWHNGVIDTLGLGSPVGPENDDLILKDNYVVGALRAAKPFKAVQCEGNTFFPRDGRFLDWPKPSIVTAASWNNNRYVGSAASTFLYASVAVPFTTWKQQTGFDANSTIVATDSTRIFVKPDRYDASRAHIAILNWAQTPMVSVDLAGIVPTNKHYEIRAAYDVFGAALVAGWYSGPVPVPMGTVTPPLPIGASLVPIAPTDGFKADIRFGAFVLTTDDTPAPPLPSPPPPPLTSDLQVYWDKTKKLFYVIDAGVRRELEIKPQ